MQKKSNLYMPTLMTPLSSTLTKLMTFIIILLFYYFIVKFYYIFQNQDLKKNF